MGEVFRLVHTVYNNIGCKQALQSGVSSEGMSGDQMSCMRPNWRACLQAIITWAMLSTSVCSSLGQSWGWTNR